MGKKIAKLYSLVILFAMSSQNVAQMPDTKQQELDHLLKHDCGSCHGLNRTGGLGPPLLADDMKKYSLEALTAVILNGLPDTAMPGWSGLLSHDEARYLAIQLKSEQE